MAKGKKASLSVLMAAISKVDSHKDRDKLIKDMLFLLVESGVCTGKEIDTLNKRWNMLIKEVKDKMSQGTPYEEAYLNVVKKYKEFNKLNLN
jgi:ElaB/YqjD/DUF883 family membrane-anchored ribosome-binding protein